MEVLEQHTSNASRRSLYRQLYEHDFRDWFLNHAEGMFRFDWQAILTSLRNTHFFFPGYCSPEHNITGEYLDERLAASLGEKLIQRLAALATTLPEGESVLRSLELDGFQVNREKLSPLLASREEQPTG